MKLGNTVIFGDSYSTFWGYIPEGYAVYYTPTREIPDVNRVEDTWWHMLTTELEGNIPTSHTFSHTGKNCYKRTFLLDFPLSQLCLVFIILTVYQYGSDKLLRLVGLATGCHIVKHPCAAITNCKGYTSIYLKTMTCGANRTR